MTCEINLFNKITFVKPKTVKNKQKKVYIVRQLTEKVSLIVCIRDD